MKKNKLLTVLLGSVWMSVNETHGDLSVYIASLQSEPLGQTAIVTVTKEREATVKAISQMIGGLDNFKGKTADEIARFSMVFSALLWSSPNATSTLMQSGGASQDPQLNSSVFQGVESSLRTVLTGDKADELWQSVTQEKPDSSGLSKELKKLGTISEQVPEQRPAEILARDKTIRVIDNTTKKVADYSGVSHLVYAEQNLSLYPNLISLSVSVSQLTSSKDITSTKALEIKVIGDASDILLSTERLVMPGAKIDMSLVTNLTTVIVSREDTGSITLPTSEVSLTVGAGVKVLGDPSLTSLSLTGTANSVPTWATDGSLTALDATLDLSGMNNLPTTLDLGGLHAEIKGLVLSAGITPTLPANQLTMIKLTGNRTSVPTWAMDGSLTASDATLDLSLMSSLPTTLDLSNLSDSNITNLILPETVISVQNMPESINKLTANIPTLASIGAYYDENLGDLFPYHITSVTIVDSTTQSIQDFFFNSASNLQSVFFKKLDSVKSIGNGVCANCYELVDISLDGLTAVTSVGIDFFADFADYYFNLYIDDPKHISATVTEAFVQNNESRFGSLTFAGRATSIPQWAMTLSRVGDLDIT